MLIKRLFSLPAGTDKNVRSKWFCPVRRTSVRRGAKTLAEKVNLFFAEKSVRISSYFSWFLCCTENKLLLIHFFVSDFFSIPAGIDKNVRSKWFCPVRRTSVRRGAKTLAEKVNLFFAEKSVRISSYFFLGFSAALKTNCYLFTFSFRTFLASPITHTRDRSMPYKSFSSLPKLRSVLRL